MRRGVERLTCLGGLLVVGALLSGCPAEPAKTPEPGANPSPETTKKRETPVTENARPETGPGTSHGALSGDFPEIEVKVSASFAHDAGMQSSVDSITIGGETCARADVLKALVARRKGWSREGGSTDQDVLQTMTAYTESWASVLQYSGRVTADEAPSNLASALSGRQVGPDEVLDYHPPRVALYKLDNGEQIVVSSAFYESDGGNHGTQWAYQVQAYRVSDGSPFKLAPGVTRRSSLRPTPAAPVGPQPIDPKIPRSCHFSEGF
jgi:hypothetical protein